MDPSEYQRVRETFDRLTGLPAERRAAELDRAFEPGDPLRQEVELLLVAVAALRQPDETVTAQNATGTAGTVTVSARGPMVRSDRLLPGQVLAGRYRLERLLGAGGFSEAYLALDEQLHGKRVVVKIPLPGCGDSDEWFERHFTDEIRALAALNHPGIVQVLDSGSDPARGQFFTEQYIEGPTLSQLLKLGPLELKRSARMLERIARALAAAHAKGVVHRDLKPQNILVNMPGTREETPVLIDFGIASLLGPDGDGTRSANTRVAGTPDYLAPEQALGRVVPESDIYALGCIAIELLTHQRLNARMAKRPAGEMPEQTAAIMLAEKTPELPETARAGLARLVSMNPGNRGTASELAAGLFRELVATPADEPAPLPIPEPSRRGWIAAAACAAAGGTGFVAWTLGLRPPAAPRELLNLQVKVNRTSRQGGSEFVSPVDGVVTRDHKVRLEAALSPAAYCYVFAESLAGGATTSDLLVLFPPQAQDRPLSWLTVPSTATDWIEFDNKPELLRLLFMAGLQPIPEAARAVDSARLKAGGMLLDRDLRSALEARIRQAPATSWQPGANGVWTVASSSSILCVEGRLQHVSA